MTPRVWTCRGCGTKNARVKQRCACGRKRPAPRRPKHMAALDLSYEHFVEVNGGEFCAVCGFVPKPGQLRLQRDHDHATGKPRGLLCPAHNKMLNTRVTPAILRAAAAYLERDLEPRGVRAVSSPIEGKAT